MRRIRVVVQILAGAVIAILLYAFLAYPSTYVVRVLTWGDADVQDYTRFPERRIETGTSTFQFTAAPDEARIRTLLEADPRIDDLDAFLTGTSTQAFLVIQHDRILYERYFNGATHESTVTSFSEAKSFTSALVGIAIAEGKIKSVNDPITLYLPELAERDPRFGAITIKHLLQMSSGIRYVEYPFLGGDNAKTYYYPDLRRLALEQSRIVEEPGAHFLYNNYHPLLLGLILERATGMPVAEYLQEKIWKPLGMERAGSWSLDREGGFEKMESGINARAIDFARFGRLYLKGGTWEGTRVVPAEWVAESTRPGGAGGQRAGYYPADSAFFSAMNGYYGYMWWGLPRGDGAPDFFALGNKGQFLYVSSQKDLIIVRHGAGYGVDAWEWVRRFRQLADGL